MREHYLWKELARNKKLKQLENDGFHRGEKQGKTINVRLPEMWKSFRKQCDDLKGAYEEVLEKQTYPYGSFSQLTQADIDHLMQCVADVRNVAGCFFLKLKDWEVIQSLAKSLGE